MLIAFSGTSINGTERHRRFSVSDNSAGFVFLWSVRWPQVKTDWSWHQHCICYSARPVACLMCQRFLFPLMALKQTCDLCARHGTGGLCGTCQRSSFGHQSDIQSDTDNAAVFSSILMWQAWGQWWVMMWQYEWLVVFLPGAQILDT